MAGKKPIHQVILAMIEVGVEELLILLGECDSLSIDHDMKILLLKHKLQILCKILALSNLTGVAALEVSDFLQTKYDLMTQVPDHFGPEISPFMSILLTTASSISGGKAL